MHEVPQRPLGNQQNDPSMRLDSVKIGSDVIGSAWADPVVEEVPMTPEQAALWADPVVEEVPMTPEQAALWADEREEIGHVALGGFGVEDYNADKYPRDLYGDGTGRGFAG